MCGVYMMHMRVVAHIQHQRSAFREESSKGYIERGFVTTGHHLGWGLGAWGLAQEMDRGQQGGKHGNSPDHLSNAIPLFGACEQQLEGPKQTQGKRICTRGPIPPEMGSSNCQEQAGVSALQPDLKSGECSRVRRLHTLVFIHSAFEQPSRSQYMSKP